MHLWVQKCCPVPGWGVEEGCWGVSRNQVLSVTIVVTPIALHSVAANSSSFRDVAEVSRYIPHPPPPKRPCRTYLATPHVAVSWGNSLAKTDRATRGYSSYTHTNRDRATLRHQDQVCKGQIPVCEAIRPLHKTLLFHLHWL